MTKVKALIKEEKTPKKIILIYADYNCVTGFGYVAKQFINELKKDKDYFIFIQALNDFSKKPYTVGKNIMVFPAYLNNDKDKHGNNDPYGRLEFLRRLNLLDVDVVFILNDVEIVTQLIPHIKNIKEHKRQKKQKLFKIVTYTPIDSPILTSQIDGFENIDVPITYTKYAKNLMELTNSKLKNKVKIIPHGINTKDFYPLDSTEKIKAKIKLFGLKNKDSFVFGSINRNQVRKDMGCILIAFADFIHGTKHYKAKQAILYLHCNPQDPKGFNMIMACKRLNLEVEKDVFFPKNFNENSGVKTQDVNLAYNAMDVFISTTTAEGWGLTIMEAMACKIPVIAPLHTSLYEVTNEGRCVHGLDINHKMIFLNDFENIRYVSNPNEVRDKMETLYISIKEDYMWGLNEITLDAYNFALKFKWDKISLKFKEIIDKLV